MAKRVKMPRTKEYSDKTYEGDSFHVLEDAVADYLIKNGDAGFLVFISNALALGKQQACRPELSKGTTISAHSDETKLMISNEWLAPIGRRSAGESYGAILPVRRLTVSAAGRLSD